MRRPQILPLPQHDAAALRGFAETDDPDLGALLRVAPQLEALFRILTPQAPRLHLVGAVFALFGRRFSATGAGLTSRAALAGCLGEAVETLSQAARAGDAPKGVIRARRLSDGVEQDLPATLFLRGPDSPPGHSLGCAAGATSDAALNAARREILERDAMARARPQPACADAARGARDLLAAAGRLGQPPRLAAFRGADGFVTILATAQQAQGAAASNDPAEAGRRAALEFCAAETGAALNSAPTPLTPQRSEDPLWAMDLTRPEFGVPVIKLAAPGLPKM